MNSIFNYKTSIRQVCQVLNDQAAASYRLSKLDSGSMAGCGYQIEDLHFIFLTNKHIRSVYWILCTVTSIGTDYFHNRCRNTSMNLMSKNLKRKI